MSLKAYVIVRGDIPKIQQGVQAGHAIAELSFQAGRRKDKIFEQWVTNDRTLIFLKARDIGDLKAHHDRIESLGLIHHLFHEPDWNNEPTALAIYPGIDVDLEPHLGMMPLA